MYLGRACTCTPANPVVAQERSGPGSYPLCSPLQPWRHHVSSLTRERQQAVKQERTRSEGQACVGLTDPLPPPPCTEHCEQAMCVQGRGDQDGAASALYQRRTEVGLPPRWRGWENPDTVWTGIGAEDTQSMLPGPYGVWDCRSHVPGTADVLPPAALKCRCPVASSCTRRGRQAWVRGGAH